MKFKIGDVVYVTYFKLDHSPPIATIIHSAGMPYNFVVRFSDGREDVFGQSWLRHVSPLEQLAECAE